MKRSYRYRSCILVAPVRYHIPSILNDVHYIINDYLSEKSLLLYKRNRLQKIKKLYVVARNKIYIRKTVRGHQRFIREGDYIRKALTTHITL